MDAKPYFSKKLLCTAPDGTYANGVSVDDNAGNSNSDSFNVTLDNIAPVAAIPARTKNMTTNTLPNGSEAKIDGMVMNNSDGPASGLNPKVKTAGKIAIPARIETVKSASMTVTAVLGIS